MSAAIFFVLMVAVWTIGNPRWLGEHLARTEYWRIFYQQHLKQEMRREIARKRLHNIRKIRNQKFKNLVD